MIAPAIGTGAGTPPSGSLFPPTTPPGYGSRPGRAHGGVDATRSIRSGTPGPSFVGPVGVRREAGGAEGGARCQEQFALGHGRSVLVGPVRVGGGRGLPPQRDVRDAHRLVVRPDARPRRGIERIDAARVARDIDDPPLRV